MCIYIYIYIYNSKTFSKMKVSKPIRKIKNRFCLKIAIFCYVK